MNHKQRKRKHLKKIKQEKNIESERNITNFEKIKKNIEENFPDLKIKYSFNNEFWKGSFIHTNGAFLFSIFKDSKWDDIKRNIEDYIYNRLFQNTFPDCLICYEKITTGSAYCRKCRYLFFVTIVF